MNLMICLFLLMIIDDLRMHDDEFICLQSYPARTKLAFGSIKRDGSVLINIDYLQVLVEPVLGVVAES